MALELSKCKSLNKEFYNIYVEGKLLQLISTKDVPFIALVTAAGGIVHNDKDEILAIYRRENWDFPKGKLEEGEKKKDCAIREVKEECGLKNVTIVKKLGTTYHTYGSRSSRKLKESIWYVMHSNDKKLVPQTEEDIQEVRWFKIKDFMLNAKPVYKNITDVFEAYLMKFTA